MHPEWQGEDVGTKGRLQAIRDATRTDTYQALSVPQRLVYRTLWDYAGTTYERADSTRYTTCHMSNAELAEASGLSERSVTRHVAGLVKSGVIAVSFDGRARLVSIPEVASLPRQYVARQPRQIVSSDSPDRAPSLATSGSQPRHIVRASKEEQSLNSSLNSSSTVGREDEKPDVGAMDFCNAYRAHRGVGSVIGNGQTGPLMATVDSLVASGEHTPRTARRFILDRLRVHDAWLREHHPKGADYGHDRFVKRLPALLTEGGYAEDPAMVHSHVKPPPSRMGGNTDRAHQYADQIASAMEAAGVDMDAPVQRPARGRQTPRAGLSTENRPETRQTPRIAQNGSEGVSGVIGEIGRDGKFRRVL